MRIVMIGAGYVGLVTGACLADVGLDVVCVDKDPLKIAKLEAGEIPIYEPGLDAIVVRAVKAGRLTFTTDMSESVRTAQAVFLAVGTPPSKYSDKADLSQVYQAAKDIAANLGGYTVVVNKSTVPLGTSRKVTAIIRAARPDAAFDVVSNPEFLREGSAIGDFMQPDRIVVGTDTERAAKVMREIYAPFTEKNAPLLLTTPESSELIKYAANCFLATKITFINEIARLCEKAGADVQHVAKGIGLDPRIGDKFLNAGPGLGGSCFPKDTRALMETGREYMTPLTIVESAISANRYTQIQLVQRIARACGGSLEGKTIAVLGLAFKAETDDMRDAPALLIVPSLQEQGAQVRAYDPAAMENAARMLSDIHFTKDPYAAAEGADAVLILTEWSEFRKLDLARLAKTLKTPCMIDLRNIFTLEEMKKTPFHYVSVGRSDVSPKG